MYQATKVEVHIYLVRGKFRQLCRIESPLLLYLSISDNWQGLDAGKREHKAGNPQHRKLSCHNASAEAYWNQIVGGSPDV
jgi:hypothetical protein